MVKMNFADPVLETIIRRWKWTRNNTILLFQKAEEKNILNYTSKTDKKVSYTFQPVIFQFQCIVTTTDAYYRKLIKTENQNFGILFVDDKVVNKKDITTELVKEQLEKQVCVLENFFKPFIYKDIKENIKAILAISDHEYLHQGELLLMFRETGIDLPERFKKAWHL